MSHYKESGKTEKASRKHSQAKSESQRRHHGKLSKKTNTTGEDFVGFDDKLQELTEIQHLKGDSIDGSSSSDDETDSDCQTDLQKRPQPRSSSGESGRKLNTKGHASQLSSTDDESDSEDSNETSDGTSDGASDDNSGKSLGLVKHKAAATMMTSASTPLPTPSKMKLKEAISSHKTTDRFAIRSAGENVLNAKSPVKSPINITRAISKSKPKAGSVLNQITELVNSAHKGKGKSAKPSTTDSSESLSPIAPKNDISSLTTPPKKPYIPSDAISIAIPTNINVAPRSNQVPRSTSKPNIPSLVRNRIEEVWGKKIADTTLNLRPETFTAPSINAIELPEHPKEQNASQKKTKERKRKIKKGEVEDSDPVVAEARRQAVRLAEHKRMKIEQGLRISPDQADEKSAKEGELAEEVGAAPEKKEKKKKKGLNDSKNNGQDAKNIIVDNETNQNGHSDNAKPEKRSMKQKQGRDDTEDESTETCGKNEKSSKKEKKSEKHHDTSQPMGGSKSRKTPKHLQSKKHDSVNGSDYSSLNLVSDSKQNKSRKRKRGAEEAHGEKESPITSVDSNKQETLSHSKKTKRTASDSTTSEGEIGELRRLAAERQTQVNEMSAQIRNLKAQIERLRH